MSLIELDSVSNSKITNVSLYSNHAEVTRLFKFSVQTGQTQIKAKGLPSSLDQQSLRVEGRGSAIIQDVVISKMSSSPGTSETLTRLNDEYDTASKALERCKKAIAAVGNYFGNLAFDSVDPSQLSNVMETYDKTGEQLDIKAAALKTRLKQIKTSIHEEKARLYSVNDELRMQVSISIWADVEGDVEIALVYAVAGANWHAAYDIRVNMNTAACITLVYKAVIRQITGESWDDVPLTLESASPTFGVALPVLDSWRLSVYQPSQPIVYSAYSAVAPQMAVGVPIPAPSTSSSSSGRSRSRSLKSRRHPPPPIMIPQSIPSQGNISATFKVPGIVTIPSDGAHHNFMIADLQLQAVMSWLAIPKKDTRVHLTAKITNASEYTLLRGPCSVYVDGSFIAKSEVPSVSPLESFDCPLGIDPSIRITYHPLATKASQSGFYTKSKNRSYTQSITVHNTKVVEVKNLKIVDQIPVSEDEKINIKLLHPPLDRSSASIASSTKGGGPTSSQVKVAAGVKAQWDQGNDLEDTGKDGKVTWTCDIPSQAKVNLTLQWTVNAPVELKVVGL